MAGLQKPQPSYLTGTMPLPGPISSPGAFVPKPSPVPLQTLSLSSSLHSPIDPAQLKYKIPWKYEGYRAFGEWMASEDDFFLFRRFESLNAQTILWMQDRISRIEERLSEMHKTVADAPLDHKRKNCSFRWDEKYMQERHHLMGELSTWLNQYNQYIEAFSKVRSRPRADARQITNVKNWLSRDAIDKKEAAFISHAGDLISINHRTRPPLGRFLESFTSLHRFRPFRAKSNPSHQASIATSYSSNSVFDNFTNIAIIFTGLAMLLAPLWWLEYTNSSEVRLRIITGFVCLFICLMSAATVNRPFEVVAATAAYAAVLMVFMQIDGKAG